MFKKIFCKFGQKLHLLNLLTWSVTPLFKPDVPGIFWASGEWFAVIRKGWFSSRCSVAARGWLWGGSWTAGGLGFARGIWTAGGLGFAGGIWTAGGLWSLFGNLLKRKKDKMFFKIIITKVLIPQEKNLENFHQYKNINRKNQIE